MSRRLAGALALVAMGISVPVAAAAAQPAGWYDGPCTDNAGITVVIDFHELGGGVNVRCAPGPVTSGLDALDKAGISWESARRFPGLVCRIAGKPGPDTEPCGNAPPLSAYWSYWVAPRGGQWCYSTVGAGSRTPPPGTIEGWSFSLNHVGSDTPPPGYSPPPPIAGTAPNPVNRSDCGAPASPPPATTTAPTVPPPAPTTVAAVPASPTVPPPTQVASEVVTATSAATGGAAPASATTTASSIVTTSVGASTTEPTTGNVDSIQRAVDAVALGATTPLGDVTASTVPLGTVDLGDDGRGDGGFGVATLIGIVVAGSLIAAGVWAARHRRAALP